MSEIGQVIVGELIGTFLLILLGNGVVANVMLKGTKGNNSGWIVLSVGWGFAVTIAGLLSSISQAHLNPAVTIGFLIGGKTAAFVGGNFAYAPIYIIVQFLGAMIGQLFVYLAYFKEYHNTEKPDDILFTFATIPANRNFIWNTITEILATFVLMMIMFGTLVIKNLMKDSGISGLNNFTTPLMVGIGVMVIGLGLGGPTGFAINPARDLGPRIMHAILPLKHKGSSDWKYAPVPVVGPLLGASIAAALVQVIAVL
ncbi:MIP/aquaporin family protein [Spiroplasma platyhelix]|uniref:Aquaporin family protein n=1 Tax=Spiroplasma platyhelix PALS-1 TaxID=1276218 RepID=A0A846TVS6_9MOLU|nr:MIP/aquaporin family protein [Spiroplasma platyhelix]MBE4703879.1 putative glycerol uptake facilitator protein [Spiroplasma platyhelix PALS-1]NKE38252.1 aquaporin family protein [Spiroplasma platyhelix PALS-1]UJB29137.1 glycerol uptake facilitator protein [Spiroplasma platyhelix PALS-1]